MRAAPVAIVITLLAVWSPIRATAREPSTVAGAGSTLAPAVAPEVARAVLCRPGAVVRSGDDFTVEVEVPLGHAGPRNPGSCLPRAIRRPVRAAHLKYVLTLNGVPLATAVPSPNQRSVVALTDDGAVTSGALALTYGGRPASESPTSASRRRSFGDRDPSRRPGPTTWRDASTTSATGRSSRPSSAPRSRSGPTCIFRRGCPTGRIRSCCSCTGTTRRATRGSRRIPLALPGRVEAAPEPRGVRHAASRLASYGYVVVSVSANGVNVFGNRLEDSGMRQRGELLEEHLDLWQTWSTTGGEPFDDWFVGRVDMTTIGTMGHSAAARVVWHVIVDRERADPFGIDAILPIAPVDFTRETVNRATLAVVLPYCDGDVFDLQGVHLFDDAPTGWRATLSRSTPSPCTGRTTTTSTPSGPRRPAIRARSTIRSRAMRRQTHAGAAATHRGCVHRRTSAGTSAARPAWTRNGPERAHRSA